MLLLFLLVDPLTLMLITLLVWASVRVRELDLECLRIVILFLVFLKLFTLAFFQTFFLLRGYLLNLTSSFIKHLSLTSLLLNHFGLSIGGHQGDVLATFLLPL